MHVNDIYVGMFDVFGEFSFELFVLIKIYIFERKIFV